MNHHYAINDIFYSLQGEGVRAGTPNIFLRFAGCNQTCRLASHGFDCDTEFVSSVPMTSDEIVSQCRLLSPTCQWIVCTGGEPLLQLDTLLVQALRTAGYALAIETNGSKSVDHLDLDWVCVSPKVAEHAIVQRTAHEVKYVRNNGQGIPKTVVHADHYLISPAFNGDRCSPKTLHHCLQLCKDNPPWRLSIQLHKFLHIL